MNTLAERMKAIRDQKGWSQTELARRSGVKQSFIGALEAKNQKTSGFLPELAHALGVDAYWLKTGKGKPQPWPSTGEIAHPITVQEPAPVSYLPNQKINELVAIANKLSDHGLERLIGQATMLAETHPRKSTGNAAM